MSDNLVDFSPHARRNLFREPAVGRHSIATLDLFSDEALAALLDRHPRERLIALTMGDDPTRPDDNRMALHDGVPGAELLRAVKQGRLWLNVVGLQDERYLALVHTLYGQLAAQCPGFLPERHKATLLLSSPSALVYYHVDGPPSVLWHLRGSKRIWVYPALDETLVARDVLEDVFAGTRHEYVPYHPDFDARAQVVDLAPGDVICWPQNAPHRIVNHDVFNVSLSTEHETAESRRRARVYCANRLLRVAGVAAHASTNERGPAAVVKAGLHWASKKLGLAPTKMKSHRPAMRVDPEAPLGCVPLSAPPG